MGEREDAITGGEFADTGTTPRATDDARAFGAGNYEGDEGDEGADAEAARLRSDIAQTRAGMGETIDAITEKLSPENIKEQVVETVRDATIGRVERAMGNLGEKVSEAAEPAYEAVGRAGAVVRDTGSSVVEVIRRNPLPAALIGIGVGLLVYNVRRGPSNDYDYYASGYEDYDEEHDEYSYNYAAGQGPARPRGETVLGRAQSAVGGAVSSVQETATGAATQARETIGRLGGNVQRGAGAAREQVQTTLERNPLAVGAVAVALGAAVGLAMPSTRVENQYMGEARDNLVGLAQQAARDTMQKVQSVAEDAGRMLQGGGQGQGQEQQGQGEQSQGQGRGQAQAAGQGSA